jgi:fructose-specific component phosphotransferase system IIB-like protein
MAEIILVHGIGQQQSSADKLESAWLPTLAGGMRSIGDADLADRLWRVAGQPGGIESRMAFYGHLFLRPDQQGDDPGEFTAEEAVMAEALAQEWLHRSAIRSSRDKDRILAQRELAYVNRMMGEEQGVGSVARSAVGSLARIPWFAAVGMALAERTIKRDLAQVTRYFTDEAVRTAAQKQVMQLVDERTKVVIGHSLGSVVAYEVAHTLGQALPLLITLGSPLGLQSIVYQRLRPQPPGFPSAVQQWVNVADKDDLVAAEPDLIPLFGSALPEGATFNGAFTADNGSDPHNAEFYLGKKKVAEVVRDVLRSG